MARHLDVAFDAVRKNGKARRIHFVMELPRGYHSREELVAAAVKEQTPRGHAVVEKTLTVKEA